MSVTAQDWRVTALQQVQRTLQHIAHAREADDVDTVDVLRDCWQAHRASGAAVGAWAESLLAGGRSWDDIGAALDLSADRARAELEPLIAAGLVHLRERLPDAVEQEHRPAPMDASGAETLGT